ncbi:amidohydrolase family protein [Dactylosporangium sp. CS-033363]|uniref:amidohydrolase family protein n=1 Tax=Dactylosporangium sp. CS-033363 TaxID=3239935 RepID=UPI003D911861
MMTEIEGETRYGIFDADVHPRTFAPAPDLVAYLPERWRRYVGEFGPFHKARGERPRHREFASRWDAQTPDGGPPGSDPAFAAEQLLDRYDMSGAMINDIAGFVMAGAGGQPAEMAGAYCRAMNEYRRDFWLAGDPRWYGSITVPYELPTAAVEEIRFCKEEMGEYNDRWKQVFLAPDNLRPAGHPSYWDIYEACEHYDLPVAFHVLAGHRITPSGSPDFYFEEHCDFALFNFPLISSLIFEGVFNRFPRLKIVLVELAWSWAVPFAWRLDHAYRMHRQEVPHLDRLPSQYLAEHVYYTTQPMEEPENDKWFDDILAQFEASGMSRNLLYSSDYPHWDFDEPAALPKTLGPEQLRRILGQNASDLYHVDLLPGTGYARP